MVFPELPSCNFLIFPTVSSISLVFPSLPFIVSSRLIVFSQCSAIFLHFPPVFNDFPSFSLVLSYFFPSVFKGPRENRTPPSPNCLVVHAPLKIPIGDPNHHLISRFRCTWATTPPTRPILTSFGKTTLPNLPAGFRNMTNLPACSFFVTLVLALQPFASPSSVSLLIPLQTVLLRTPTDAALRWASDP